MTISPFLPCSYDSLTSRHLSSSCPQIGHLRWPRSLKVSDILRPFPMIALLETENPHDIFLDFGLDIKV